MIFFLAVAIVGAVFVLGGRGEDMSAFGNVEPSLLYPPFEERVKRVLAACHARGAVYEITSGFRGYAEQDEIFAQGRTIPGVVVTNARGGQSQHNFGIAVDMVRVRGKQKSWVASDFDILIEEVKREGLHTGESYNDRPHVGWPTYWRGAELAVLDSVFRRKNSLTDVWKFLDGTRGVA